MPRPAAVLNLVGGEPRAMDRGIHDRRLRFKAQRPAEILDQGGDGPSLSTSYFFLGWILMVRLASRSRWIGVPFFCSKIGRFVCSPATARRRRRGGGDEGGRDTVGVAQGGGPPRPRLPVLQLLRRIPLSYMSQINPNDVVIPKRTPNTIVKRLSYITVDKQDKDALPLFGGRQSWKQEESFKLNAIMKMSGSGIKAHTRLMQEFPASTHTQATPRRGDSHAFAPTPSPAFCPRPSPSGTEFNALIAHIRT